MSVSDNTCGFQKLTFVPLVMKYDGLNGFSVYCSFRREVHICQDELIELGTHDFVCVCVCVLCLRLGDSISSSISQSNGRETGQLSFSLVYFAAVACWHISIPSSMSGGEHLLPMDHQAVPYL